jgi:hypothetical protein
MADLFKCVCLICHKVFRSPDGELQDLCKACAKGKAA